MKGLFDLIKKIPLGIWLTLLAFIGFPIFASVIIYPLLSDFSETYDIPLQALLDFNNKIEWVSRVQGMIVFYAFHELINGNR